MDSQRPQAAHLNGGCSDPPNPNTDRADDINPALPTIRNGIYLGS